VIIGLTGLYCAGKNHAGLLLEKRGLPVLDVDTLGHEVIRTETEAIVSRFGSGVLGPDGSSVDRRLLGKQVFGKPEAMAALEAIVHPAANRLTGEWIASQTRPCVINAALLHKSSFYEKLSAIIVVEAPLPVRFFRAVKRDKLPLKEFLGRFVSQRDFPRYKSHTGRSAANGAQLFPVSADIYIVLNFGFPGSRWNLEKRIDAILEGLHHGKEKTIIGSGLGGSISGDRGKRRDSDF